MLVNAAMAFRATSGAAPVLALIAAFPVERLETLQKSPHLWDDVADALTPSDAPLALSFSEALRDYLKSLRPGETIDPRVASAWILLRT